MAGLAGLNEGRCHVFLKNNNFEIVFLAQRKISHFQNYFSY